MRNTLIALIVLVISAITLTAQANEINCEGSNEYMEVVRSQAEAFGDVLSDDYTLVNILCGSLEDDATTTYDSTIPNWDDVLYVGVCDQDCGDLDLRLYRGEELVTADTEVDDFPVIEYNSFIGADSFHLQVDMYSCSVEPCYYAVAMFTKN